MAGADIIVSPYVRAFNPQQNPGLVCPRTDTAREVLCDSARKDPLSFSH
jgi:hypothetical protein